MAKLARKSAKLFAEDAVAGVGGVGQFGSLAEGDINYSKDPDVIQALDAYKYGWSAAVTGNKSPAIEDRNALDYLLSYQQKYILQQGVPEWLSTETYYKNSYVVDSNGELRVSKIDNNTNTNPALDEVGQYWGFAGARGSSHNIGEIIYSTLPLTDAGLHLLDGALLSGSGVYSDFVTYVAGMVSTYPSLFTTEANWQTSVTTYGVCGKFVYDSTNNTVRLPKTSSATRYLIDSNMSGSNWYRIYSDGWCEQGGYVSNSTASVPITVNLIKTMTNTNYTVEVQYEGNTTGGAGSDYNNIVGSLAVGSFVARVDNRNIFWQAKGYVDVSSYKADTIYTYIVTANTTKTEIQSDIDEIASDLNLKAGTDLANLNDAGSIVAAKASMPSGNYDTITMPASGGTVTAPSDGYFWLGGTADNVSAITRGVMRRTSDRFGVSFGSQNVSATGGWTGGFVPVRKGDKVAIYYVNITADHSLRFFYAVGTVSEQ